MPRRSSPKIHKIVLYDMEYILDENGNRTDEDRPSKKDPRVRKCKMKSYYSKLMTRKKKKNIIHQKFSNFEQCSNNSGSSKLEQNNLNSFFNFNTTNTNDDKIDFFNNLPNDFEMESEDNFLFEYDKTEFY